MSVETDGWPPDGELRQMAERAIAAAVAEVRAISATALPLSYPSPQGGGDVPMAEVSLLFTDDDHIRRLNSAYRGKDKPTNVLSFPQSGGPLLGDVILAWETVQSEAALAGKPLEAHMAHLIIHGFLHLLGYDHETEEDAGTMEALERAALERMGIADPYAAA
jgi:probable rRNA maturation factor